MKLRGHRYNLLAFMIFLAACTPEEIIGIISGIVTGITAIIAAVGKIINEKRRKNGNNKCCLTGRTLKPKKKRSNK